MRRVLTSVCRAWRAVLLAAVFAMTYPGAVAGRSAVQTQMDDSQAKAAFLLNLAKFVQWPNPGSGTLVIGIVGDNAFAEVLAKTVLGRSVSGRQVETRRLAGGEDPSGCAIVFIGAVRSSDEDDWLQRLRGPVLTVGDSARFLRSGGMVRLYIDDRRIRFQVNQKNVEATGLKVSSQLLVLASQNDRP